MDLDRLINYFITVDIDLVAGFSFTIDAIIIIERFPVSRTLDLFTKLNAAELKSYDVFVNISGFVKANIEKNTLRL